jgi:Uma2 family endonuclease
LGEVSCFFNPLSNFDKNLAPENVKLYLLLSKNLCTFEKKYKMSAVATANFVENNEKAKRLITLETFHRLYDNREDDYKYEWHNGIVEKTPRTMNRSQFFIVQTLSRLFLQTQAFQQKGELEREVKMFLPKANRTRVADLAYLDAHQVRETDDIRPGISEFVIEIISKTDRAHDVQEKLDEYFADGIKVVWQIYPKLKLVEVYTAPDNVKICRATAICSAAPVLPDFNIMAQDIFA